MVNGNLIVSLKKVSIQDKDRASVIPSEEGAEIHSSLCPWYPYLLGCREQSAFLAQGWGIMMPAPSEKQLNFPQTTVLPSSADLGQLLQPQHMPQSLPGSMHCQSFPHFLQPFFHSVHPFGVQLNTWCDQSAEKVQDQMSSQMTSGACSDPTRRDHQGNRSLSYRHR
eukprot:scpid90912/ scgid21163/ 